MLSHLLVRFKRPSARPPAMQKRPREEGEEYEFGQHEEHQKGNTEDEEAQVAAEYECCNEFSFPDPELPPLIQTDAPAQPPAESNQQTIPPSLETKRISPSLSPPTKRRRLESDLNSTRPRPIRGITVLDRLSSDYLPGHGPEHTLTSNDVWWASLPNEAMDTTAAWIVYDFGSPCAVTAVKLRHRRLSIRDVEEQGGEQGCPRDVRIDAADSASGPWHHVISVVMDVRRGEDTFEIVPSEKRNDKIEGKRYWKLTFLTNHGCELPDAPRYWLREVEFIGTRPKRW